MIVAALRIDRDGAALTLLAEPGGTRWTLRLGLAIYAVLMPLQLASAWFNPLSFLDPNAPVAAGYGAMFWLRVALWQPVIFSLSVFFLVVTLEWLRSGSLRFARHEKRAGSAAAGPG